MAGGAGATDFGTLVVLENDALNYTSSVSVAKGPGSYGNWSIGKTVNRGDYDLSFGTTNDILLGVPILCVSEEGRDNSATGSAKGVQYATASFDTGAGYYWTAVARAPAGDEWNCNPSFVFFPFDEWMAARVDNSVVNGEMTTLVGSPGINLGTEFVDSTISPTGVYQLNLTGLGASSQAGVLLTVGYNNSDNYALSKANADGTFTIYCHDNGQDGMTNENDGVGFAYIPAGDVGTKNLVACGRVRSGGASSVAGGDFTVTKGTAGIWYLKIPGHTRYSGTLVVSAAGGTSATYDNVVSCQWDESNDWWRVSSRDLPGPTLQDGGAAEEMFSFAYFSAEAVPPPAVAVTVPVRNAVIPAGQSVTVVAAARAFGDKTVGAVEFFANGQSLGVDTEAPFSVQYDGGLTGRVAFAATAIDSSSVTGTASGVSVWVEPPSPARTSLSAALVGSPAWTVRATSPREHKFESAGTAKGVVALCVNGTYPVFSNGVFLASSWNESLDDTNALDNIVMPYENAARTRVYVSVMDISDNTTNANPSAVKENAGTAIAFLPFSDGWIGASISSTGIPTSGNFAGVTVNSPADTSVYSINGLPPGGNVLAVPLCDNGGADSDNALSVRQQGTTWFVDIIDNSTNRQASEFSFVYIPTNATGVYSGRVRGGTGTALNAALMKAGVTVNYSTDASTGATNAYTLTIGNGGVVNPKTAALFMTGDSTVGGATDPARDNLWSWCADGNSFKVFSQGMPVLNGSFEASNFSFLVVPFTDTPRGTVVMFK